MKAILLAAGSGRRMGCDKLWVDIGGEPLIVRAVRPYVAAGLQVVVVVRPGVRLAMGGVRTVECEDHAEGMGASLRAGVEAVTETEAFVIGLGDLPWLRTETVVGAVEAWRRVGGVVVPTFDGRHGHPVVVAGTLRGRLLAARGDSGGRHLRAGAHLWQTDDPGVVTDVDTPEDLALMGGASP
ncbi:MAG: hypothetical protein AMXMBFR64_21490 [Myxococcales bacterium]